ncbi:Lnb N-terminal periplasmic domain-containing protein, partial [Aliarcobacter butzleri]|uniref:Lnb N-terminal periplasmic domain-containing protein n=1 Tax=Aliarcobacter butzleri TaxID=28197 RepID=UPI00126102B1
FLKVGGDKETPLISNAINYAAKTDEKNGLIFAYNGLFGGYEGRYSIMPYYEKIKEYNNLEQRDVWEYDLNLSQEEINKLVLHTWELKDSYANYYFFKENCSYNVLWLLEIARPSLDLVSYFDFKAIPLDTIKILTKYDGLIVDSRYRYSNLKKMKHILNEEIENKEFLKAYINDEIELPDSLSQSDKISYLDFKIAYTQYQRSEDGTEKKEYIKNYLKLLKERSAYKQTRTYNIKSPLDPLISHDSARIGLFYDSNDSFEASIKPAYNDMYDIVDGYLQGAYIDFFELNFKKQKDKDVKLDRFTLIKIKSYSPQDMIFKPISWGIDAGYEHFKDKDDYFKIKPEVGVSFGNDKDFIYSMLGSNIYYKGNDQLYSAGVNIGFITNRIENFNIGVNYTYDKYNKSLENNQFEAFTTYKVHRNLALNLKYINDDLYEKQDRVKVGVMFYF